MSPSSSFKELFDSLGRRRRPEDVAQLILDSKEILLNSRTVALVQKAAKGSLRQGPFSYSSMSAEFAPTIGCERQIAKGKELFPDIGYSGGPGARPTDADAFVVAAAPVIAMKPGESDFIADRLNRRNRKEAGLEISKRQYNKRFRFLRRLGRKRDRFALELRKRSYTLIGKSRLASQISEDAFFRHPLSAAFIGYYTARCNLRSEFTISGQQRPYDEIADALFNQCQAQSRDASWLAIAYAFPELEVLSRLTEEQKGSLLAKWFAVLTEISELLRDIWRTSEINRTSMIVRRGNDSTTWNNTASAWNKARDSWFKLLFSLGMEDVIDAMCPGKVLRLMAADVVAWHRASGNTLEEDTKVWCAIPLPWEVISGDARCTKFFVEEMCHQYKVDPIKKGWIAPPPERKVARYRPTPELVHGVTVGHPGLAKLLRNVGFFSGKQIKI